MNQVTSHELCMSYGSSDQYDLHRNSVVDYMPIFRNKTVDIKQLYHLEIDATMFQLQSLIQHILFAKAQHDEISKLLNKPTTYHLLQIHQ